MAKTPARKTPAKAKAAAKAKRGAKAKPAAVRKPGRVSTKVAKAKPASAGRPTAKVARANKRPAAGSSGAGMLEKVRALCAALPETTEVEAWGHPTFRVGDKIFAGFGNDEGGAPGVVTLGVKTTMDMQAALVSSDPRFSIAKYVGKHGWVSLRLAHDAVNWDEIDALLRGSYRLIAPPKLVRRLDESGG
ncbi:MAG TPA: MmcQ/YjbR family DNA-binding protein [Polyangia bacterium]